MSDKDKTLKNKKAPVCLNCGAIIVEVYDEIAKKFIGYSWKCSCLPKNVIISIG